MCKWCGELVNHLLLHCPIAYELWSMVFSLFGIHWVMPYKVIELLASWQGKFGRHWNIDFWRFVPHCLFWCLWWERNARYFEDCERSILDVKVIFLPKSTCKSLFATAVHFQCTWPFVLNKISYIKKREYIFKPMYFTSVLIIVYFLSKNF